MDNNLLILREANNFTGSFIAAQLGISNSAYSQWENSRIPIPTRRLIDLSNFYNINVDFILRLTNIKIWTKYDPNINLKQIGKNLQIVRQHLGLSLRELGDKLNYSFSALSSYERGEHLIQSDILRGLCKISNYSVDWILGRSNYMYLA